MKSNICIVKQGGFGLKSVLTETKKVIVYNELQQKEALRLNLLAEELVGMLSELMKDFEGCFWIQNDGNRYELHAEISVERLDKEKKEELIAISANKKNAAASGFMGKIRDIAENMLLSADDSPIYPCVPEFDGYTLSDIHYTYAWSLDYYVNRQKLKDTEGGNDWDELEKSIVANLADDVIVGVRGKKVEIIIKKEF